MFPRNKRSPKTATPEHGNLKGSLLAATIKKLPRWRQALELGPKWFTDVGVMMLYKMDVEKISVVSTDGTFATDRLCHAMQAEGFFFGIRTARRTPGVRHLGVYVKKAQKTTTDIPALIAFMESETLMAHTWQLDPHLPSTPLPDSRTVAYTLNTPIGETFHLAAGYFDKPDRHQGHRTCGKSTALLTSQPHACIDAQMELFQDKANMQSLITTIWTALRTLDGTIKPWQAGENAFEVNPQLKDATHHIYKCLLAFWKSTFGNRAPPTAPFAWSREDWQVWCRAHGRIEQVNYAYAKLFALATGIFPFEQWIGLVPNNCKKDVDNQ